MTRLATVAVNRCILLPLFAPPAPPLAARLRRFVLRFCCLVELTFPLDSEPLGAVIRPSARAVRHRRPESRGRPCLLDARGLGARGVQREGAGGSLDAAAAAHPRPDHGPAVGRTEGDAGPDGEGGGAGGPDGDVQPGRGGTDALAGAAGGGQGQQRGRRSGGPDAANVRDTPAATGLRRGADTARERAPAAVGDRAAVLSLGST